MIRHCKCVGDDKNKLGLNIFIKWGTLVCLCSLPPSPPPPPKKGGGGGKKKI